MKKPDEFEEKIREFIIKVGAAGYCGAVHGKEIDKLEKELIGIIDKISSKAIREARKQEWERLCNILDFDHSKCLTASSCIGYQNAQSDLLNNSPEDNH